MSRRRIDAWKDEDSMAELENEKDIEKEIDYREAFEKEREKCADLQDRIVVLRSENEELQFKLDRIKNNKLWKMTGPARKVYHFAKRQSDRLKTTGGPKDILRKVRNKARQRGLMENYGTASFPDAETRKMESGMQFPKMPKISILVPLWNNKREYQIQMLDSVMNQTYGNWELCLADGSDAEHSYIEEICKEYAARANGRIVYKKLDHNGGISYNTNECLKLATGDFIGLFDQDDILHPSVLYAYVKEINEKGADYLYCDETTFGNDNINRMLTMHFKPDYAPDNLRSNNYICHFSVFSRTLLAGEELFRPAFDGAQDHDMILRLTDRARCIVHVPRLMYYWRSHEGSTAAGISAKPYAIEAGKGAVAEHLTKHGFSHFQITSTRACETIFRIRYRIEGTPKITILIPNKDHVADLKRCVGSILKNSTWSNYEILIVENNSETPEIKDYYTQLLGYSGDDTYAKREAEHTVAGCDGGILRSKDGKIGIVRYVGAFNYSAINNLGASYAKGDYLLLLNNDTEVITANWMEELLMYAQREDVGAVGAKLYYADHTIQHAGVVIGLGAHRTAGHTHYRVPSQNLGYMGRLCYVQDVTAVTGACLLVRKQVFDEVRGLDEGFAISLNDVDFCLKLRENGYLNVWTPFAQLFHYESVSRGLDDQGEKAERYNRESEKFREKWKDALAAGDPYYNPNFSLDRSDFALKG